MRITTLILLITTLLAGSSSSKKISGVYGVLKYLLLEERANLALTNLELGQEAMYEAQTELKSLNDSNLCTREATENLKSILHATIKNEDLVRTLKNEKEFDCVFVGARYSGTDRSESRIKETYAKNSVECQKECQTTSECNFFLYFSKAHYQRFKHGVCRLLRFSGELQNNMTGHISGPKSCSESLKMGWIDKVTSKWNQSCHLLKTYSNRLDALDVLTKNNISCLESNLTKTIMNLLSSSEDSESHENLLIKRIVHELMEKHCSVDKKNSDSQSKDDEEIAQLRNLLKSKELSSKPATIFKDGFIIKTDDENEEDVVSTERVGETFITIESADIDEPLVPSESAEESPSSTEFHNDYPNLAESGDIITISEDKKPVDKEADKMQNPDVKFERISKINKDFVDIDEDESKTDSIKEKEQDNATLFDTKLPKDGEEFNVIDSSTPGIINQSMEDSEKSDETTTKIEEPKEILALSLEDSKMTSTLSPNVVMDDETNTDVVPNLLETTTGPFSITLPTSTSEEEFTNKPTPSIIWLKRLVPSKEATTMRIADNENEGFKNDTGSPELLTITESSVLTNSSKNNDAGKNLIIESKEDFPEETNASENKDTANKSIERAELKDVNSDNESKVSQLSSTLPKPEKIIQNPQVVKNDEKEGEKRLNSLPSETTTEKTRERAKPKKFTIANLLSTLKSSMSENVTKKTGKITFPDKLVSVEYPSQPIPRDAKFSNIEISEDKLPFFLRILKKYLARKENLTEGKGTTSSSTPPKIPRRGRIFLYPKILKLYPNKKNSPQALWLRFYKLKTE